MIISSKTERLIQKNDFFLTRGHDFVEIGGIKWATCNIGAKKPIDTGLYFQWGDTQGYKPEQVGYGEGKKCFSWDYYKFGNPNNNNNRLKKYSPLDKKFALDISDDSARFNWGGAWRMPTKKDFLHLKDSTVYEWVENYKNTVTNGMLFTDRSDSSKVLFFPACGYLSNIGRMVEFNNDGTYWSSTLSSFSDLSACTCMLKSVNPCFGGNDRRCFGFQIRPILG